jgi:putative transcriptional regulator
MAKRYRSRVMRSIHEAASGLYMSGGMDQKTTRRFDLLCLTPIQKMTPKRIRDLLKREKPSQAVFAAFLNVTPASSANGNAERRIPKDLR